MKLRSYATPVQNVSLKTRQEMFELLVACYHNVFWEQFQRDLAEKQWTIIIEDSETHALKGFSTLKVFLHDFQGEKSRVAFSGDTIISPSCWGSLRLPMAFGKLMLYVLSEKPDIPLYWMLITKGIRTYRVLPVFFKKFYPRYDDEIPDQIHQMMKSLGFGCFPQQYDDEAGIIRAGAASQSLRREFSGEEELQLRDDGHVKHFLRANPGHIKGDELLCLAEFSLGNLCPYIIRQLEKADDVKILRNDKQLSGV